MTVNRNTDSKLSEARKLSLAIQRKTTIEFSKINLQDHDDMDIVHEPRILTLADIDEKTMQ